jgi:hypothetical protein
VNRLVAGKMNCVGEVDLLAGGGTYLVGDPLVSELSVILVHEFWWLDTSVPAPVLAGPGEVTFQVLPGAVGRVMRYAVIG